MYLNLIIFLFLGPQNYKNEFLGWLVPKKSRICLKIWKSFASPRCGKLRPNFESCSEQGTQTYWGTSVDHTGRSGHWFVSFVYDIFEHQRSHCGISTWHLFQVGLYCRKPDVFLPGRRTFKTFKNRKKESKNCFQFFSCFQFFWFTFLMRRSFNLMDFNEILLFPGLLLSTLQLRDLPCRVNVWTKSWRLRDLILIRNVRIFWNYKVFFFHFSSN